MQVLDASSAIYAWDNYPLNQFPRMWDWFAAEIAAGRICTCDAAKTEIGHKAQACLDWLVNAGIKVHSPDNAILAEALRIKSLLGIQNDNYHTAGVDENDILVIASAKVLGACVVSNEALQHNVPKDIRKLKIPGVCSREAVKVPCLDFLKLIISSGAVFT